MHPPPNVITGSHAVPANGMVGELMDTATPLVGAAEQRITKHCPMRGNDGHPCRGYQTKTGMCAGHSRQAGLID